MFKDVEELKEALHEHDLDDAVVFDGPGMDYITAVIGIDYSEGRVIYDYDLMVKYLENQGMSVEDAMDWISYNTLRSLPYAGANAPIVMEKLPEMYD